MSQVDPTRARLLEAAGEEFAAKGFEGATVRAICTRAGANLAAVNYYFGDKEGLYTQAVFEAHRCGVALPPVDDFFEGPTPGEQLRAYIRNFLTHVLAISGKGTWHQALMLREMLRPTNASASLVREVIRPRFEGLMTILRRVCPEADERRLHVTVFSIIGQCMHYRVCRPITEQLIGVEEFAGLDLEYLTEHITRFTLAALGLAEPLGSSMIGDGA